MFQSFVYGFAVWCTKFHAQYTVMKRKHHLRSGIRKFRIRQPHSCPRSTHNGKSQKQMVAAAPIRTLNRTWMPLPQLRELRCGLIRCAWGRTTCMRGGQRQLDARQRRRRHPGVPQWSMRGEMASTRRPVSSSSEAAAAAYGGPYACTQFSLLGPIHCCPAPAAASS